MQDVFFTAKGVTRRSVNQEATSIRKMLTLLRVPCSVTASTALSAFNSALPQGMLV